MQIWLFIILLLILGSLSILFSILFFKENRNKNSRKYPDRSIKKFISDNLLAIYAIFDAFMILSFIAVATTFAI